jgi:transposase-like protein
MAYSVDFRRKVLDIKERDGLSIEKAAVRFGIGQAGIFRWTKRLARNKPSVKIDRECLLRDVEKYPDAYQHERADRPGCSQRGISDALKRFGISRKKNVSASGSG